MNNFLKKNQRLLTALPAFFFVATAIGADPMQAETGAASPARVLEQSFIDVYEKVAPSVVVIRVERPGSLRPFLFNAPDFPTDGTGEDAKVPPSKQSLSQPSPSKRDWETGSGCIIESGGYIVTNFHVVNQARVVQVFLKDGRRFDADLVGSDSKTDLALLKIDVDGLAAILPGDPEKARIGQWTLGIGAPFNLEYSYSVGWLTGKKRGGLIEDQCIPYLQTTAPMNPGNSGGPLCDIDGRVLGINTLIQVNGAGLGFAIPMDLVSEVCKQLKETGKIVRPSLGIETVSLRDVVEPMLRYLPETSVGVLVKRIRARSPASQSPLKQFDVVVAVDDRPVCNITDLQSEMIRKRHGQTIRLTVFRRIPGHGSTSIDIPVILNNPAASALQEPAQRNDALPRKKEKELGDPLGLEVAAITDDLAQKFGISISQGVVVTKVYSNGAAAHSGLEPGAVITDIDQAPVVNREVYSKMVQCFQAAKGMLVFYNRQGEQSSVFIRQVLQP